MRPTTSGSGAWTLSRSTTQFSGAVRSATNNLKKSARKRTHQWVRHSSFAVGEREDRRWRQANTFSAAEHNARMRAAEQFDRETKLPGKRNGALGHIGLEVLRLLLRRRNRTTGQLDPSYGWIAAELHRSRSAVARALARLKRHKFIDWIRRVQAIEEPGPDGQVVQQVSNAYFFDLPREAAALVARMRSRASAAVQSAITRCERSKRRDRAARAKTVAAAAAPTHGVESALARVYAQWKTDRENN